LIIAVVFNKIKGLLVNLISIKNPKTIKCAGLPGRENNPILQHLIYPQEIIFLKGDVN
jgi:hypothetical protein